MWYRYSLGMNKMIQMLPLYTTGMTLYFPVLKHFNFFF